MRDHRRGRVFVPVCEHDFNTVGRQHFERAGTGRYRQRVSVDPEEQRAAYALLLAVITKSLTDGKNMVLVESARKSGTTMPRCAERNPLLLHGRIRHVSVIGRHESGYVDQHCWRGRLACQGTYSRSISCITHMAPAMFERGSSRLT